MIITKTPYRISFFGGGSDYPEWYERFGGEVLSTTINKYIYISLRELPNFFRHNYRVSYSINEEVKKLSQIKHFVVREAIANYLKNTNLEIHYDGDLPSRSGMGSSSSFVVGLLNTMHLFKSKRLKKKEIALKSLDFEQKTLKECVGSQDQIAASYGGFNYIKFKQDKSFSVSQVENEKFKKNLNKNLVLIYTGQQRTAHKIASKFVKKLTNTKKNEIKEILNCVAESKKIIKNGSTHDFGRLLHESWVIKKKLDKSIFNNKIDDIYMLATKNGALGGKLLGAGGGGFFLFYIPEYKKKNFLKKMKSFINIPFKFENEGTKEIFNNG